jgi:hypothetical protein
MGIELVASVLGALLSMVVGGAGFSDAIRKLLLHFFRHRSPPEKTYSERLAELSQSLQTSSMQVDEVLSELASVAKERERNIVTLEQELAALESREKDMKQRIESLQNIPLPAVEHLAKMIAPIEKRSARRDYMLFGVGVVVTTIITIVLRLVGFG